MPGTDRRARVRDNGQGTVSRSPKTGAWIARLTVGYDGRGRQVRRSFSGKTRAEAVRRMNAARSALDAGLAVPDERTTVAEWMDRWIGGLGASVTESTREAYEHRTRLYITPHLGAVKLVKLTPTHVRDWLCTLDAAGLAPDTRKGARAALRRALRIAEQEGLVPRNVAAIADGPRADGRRSASLTPAQAKALVEASNRPAPRPSGRRGRPATALQRVAMAIVVALGLGLRKGEVLGLRWSDVDTTADPPRLVVRGQLTRTKASGLHWKPTKTARHREMVLPAVVVAALETQRRRQNEDRLQVGAAWAEHDFVFTTAAGTPIEPRNFARWLSTAATDLGIGHVNPHKLRHSAASLALAEGVPLEVVSELLGHSSIRTTKDVYGHLVGHQKEQAAAALDRALAPSS